MESVADLVCLRNGVAAPLFVLELVLACDRSGIQLAVVGGEVVASAPERPEMIDDELIHDLRFLGPGVVAILLNTPGDSPDRRF